MKSFFALSTLILLSLASASAHAGTICGKVLMIEDSSVAAVDSGPDYSNMDQGSNPSSITPAHDVVSVSMKSGTGGSYFVLDAKNDAEQITLLLGALSGNDDVCYDVATKKLSITNPNAHL